MIRYFQVDAFTDRPFAGNPAAVVPLEAAAPAAWMQRVATQFNLSETAFLVPEGEGLWHLRWFTPAVEVPLCGHATLASAHALFESGESAGQLRFRTQSGELVVRRDAAGGYTMDFPALPPEGWQPPATALEALGLAETVEVAASFHHADDWYVVIELPQAEDVRAVAPDMGALGREPGGGWIVTARADERARRDFGDDVDIVSRFFAPALGVDEDPVTGSAHCVLAPYWQPRLGRDAFLAAQISRRGGLVRCRLEDARVELGGQAVTVARGELLAPPSPSSAPKGETSL